MLTTSLWRLVLVTMPVVSALSASFGCSHVALRRSLAGAVADTAPEPAIPPEASGGRRRVKDGAREVPTVAGENFGRIRRMLRHLVTAEETFFAENGTYSDDLGLIRLIPDTNVTIRFLWLSRDGWAASGTHPGLPGRDCVVFGGQAEAPPTTLKYVRHGREGVPVCDDASGVSEPLATSPPQPKPAPAVDTVSALDDLRPTMAMKVDLRNLVHSQEIYFGTQGIYSRRTERLGLQYLWHRGVRVKILSADAQSWAAKATHARLPGRSCVIWFGAMAQRPVTDHQRRASDRSGIPVCDE